MLFDILKFRCELSLVYIPVLFWVTFVTSVYMLVLFWVTFIIAFRENILMDKTHNLLNPIHECVSQDGFVHTAPDAAYRVIILAC